MPLLLSCASGKMRLVAEQDELLPKFRRWRSIAVAQAQFKFTNITPTGIASTSAPSTSGCCVKPKPLIASCQSALSAAMCACAQFCKLAGCFCDLCRRCCDALANEAKVVGEDIPSCIAHQPDGVSTSLASFSLKGCVTSTVLASLLGILKGSILSLA